MGFFAVMHLQASHQQAALTSLYRETRIASEWISVLLQQKPQDIAQLTTRTKIAGASRISVIDSSGKVLADTEVELNKLDNHSDRPEIIQASLNGEADSFRSSHSLGTDLLYVARRIKLPDGTVYFVRLSQHIDNLKLNSLIAAIIGVMGLSMFATGAVSYYLARRHASPLVQLNQFADAAAKGDLSQRVLLIGNDETASLARNLNTMAESLSGLLEQVKKDKSELAAILESMAEGVIATNLRQEILLINESAVRLLSFGLLGPASRNLWEVVRDKQILTAVKQVQSEPGRRTVTVGSISGRKLEVAVSTFPAMGQLQGIIIVAHDVTESSRYQELRKEFVANVSHELRTPLTVISGFVETLQDGAINDPIKCPEYLATISRHTDQLTNLVNDLLELSRLESQPSRPKQQDFHVGPVVKKVVGLLGPIAERKNQKLILNSMDPLPDIVGNPDYVERAISNLMENAIKYTRNDGTIEVTVDSNTTHVLFIVKDNGIGIPEEDQVRIFERFYRVDRSRSREMGGTGLGLSIVKHVAQVHGGMISVKSAPGKGSIFTLELPISPNAPR